MRYISSSPKAGVAEWGWSYLGVEDGSVLCWERVASFPFRRCMERARFRHPFASTGQEQRSSTVVAMPSEADLIESARDRPSGALVKRRRVDGPDDKEIEAVTREACLGKWRRVILIVPSAAAVGAQMAATDSPAEAELTLSLAVASKRTGTLYNRLCSILMYERFAIDHLEGPGFPFTEQDAFKYVTYLLEHQAPPTRAGNFRATVAFMKGAFGMQGCDAVLGSPRVSGCALTALNAKRPLKQRDPFRVWWLQELETFLHGENDAKDEIFVGFLCFVVHTRSRWGDASQVTQEPSLDLSSDGRAGYVEAPTIHTKTSNSKHNRRRPLALTADAFGVSGLSWAACWLGLRREEGLVVGEGSPIMTEPLEQGGRGRRSLSARDATEWMREILAIIGVEAEANEERGHALVQSNSAVLGSKSGDGQAIQTQPGIS